MAAADGLWVAVGKALFERDWVAAPASTRATDGLGPLHNARACAACHPRGGRAPTNEGPGLVVRFSLGSGAYGAQLQTAAVHGHAAEGRLAVSYAEETVELADGLEVRLRWPRYRIEAAALGPPPDRLSPRLAPSLRGVSLLAAVPEAALTARADPLDRDGDGIRGRPGAGRLGLRAERLDLDDQIAEALLRDLGLSSPARPSPAGDCTAAQPACLAGPHGDREGTPGVEMPPPILAALGAYVGALRAGPGSLPVEPTAGGRVFDAVGCSACHARELPVVGEDGRERRIAPFTDLLLHDMGSGLADQGVGPDAIDARLWRTAPLWNLGRDVAAGASLLHDGRARDPVEAILWHGGEAAAARERFRGLPAPERAALLAFLASLQPGE
jgi:CxxC motif-containing protein (DUF1111 family)